MTILLLTLGIIIHLLAGWYALKLIKKRDVDAPIAVDIIVVLHGIISLITTWTVQNLLFPNEEEGKTVFLRDGMTLDMENPEHVEIYEKLKQMNKK